MGGHHNTTSNPLQATPPPSSAFAVITRAARSVGRRRPHDLAPVRSPPPGIGAAAARDAHRQRRFSSMALGAMARGK